jgi:hypothetical protein
MKNNKKLLWIIISLVVLLFLCIGAALIFSFLNRSNPVLPTEYSEESTNQMYSKYIPGQLPEGIDFAVVDDGPELSDQELYDGYSHEEDPVHPVLDVRTSLQISNLGSQPGAPRPQDIELEYPHILIPPSLMPPATPTPVPTVTPTPTVTLAPGIDPPGRDPDIDLPPLNLPELYIVNTDIPSPCFPGGTYHLVWAYSGGRKLIYDISLSTDGGTEFHPILEDIDETECDLTMPDAISGQCVLRVSGILNGSVYLTADSSTFSIVAAPEILPPPITEYVDPQVQYVNIPGLRINRIPELPVWFKAENKAGDASKLIWELSRTPFLGTKECFGQDGAILVSGEIEKTGGEFSIDLHSLCKEMAKTDGERDSSIGFYPERDIYEFYLRIVALDTNGNCIGDPGRGLYFSYGIPDVVVDNVTEKMIEEPQIQMQVYVPYYWEHHWERISPGVLDQSPDVESNYLMFAGMDGPHDTDTDDSVLYDWSDEEEGDGLPEAGIGSAIISKAVQVEIQISTSPFSNTGASELSSPKGLVYQHTDTAPDIGYSDNLGTTYYTPTGYGIEYDQFLPDINDIEAMGGIYYYVRGIFYVPDDENPSVMHAYPSETLTIAYRATTASKNEIEVIEVKSYMPFVQFVRYSPIQWQQQDYDRYFIVTRHIEAEEMTFSFSYKGEYLLDYNTHISMYGWTREQYQAKLDEMLPPGRVLHYTPAESGFWDQFFELLSAIYKGISKAYADAKDAIVGLVDYIPFVSDEVKDYLKQAVTYAIDYGLASIGLPPSLPNLDQLASGGIEYLTKVAIQEALAAAGVPADSSAASEITEKVEQEIADGILSELQRSILAQRQNPFNVDFLRLDSRKLYCPAIVQIIVSNVSDTYTTRAGRVGFSSGNGFDVYKSKGADIPALKPGESVLIWMYLDHLRNKYDGYNQYFDAIYNGNNGPYVMQIQANFNLPDVNAAAAEQGLVRAPLPKVTQFVYDHEEYSYSRNFVPAEDIYDEDPTPDIFDYMDDTNFGED